jgi:hypothetical protein
MRKIILAVVAVALLNIVMPMALVGQEHATAQEVVAKVREAASTLSKTGDVAQFNQKQGPWVWKDTYIFVFDCDKKVRAAYPQAGDNRQRHRSHLAEGHQGQDSLPGPARFLRCSQATFRHLGRVLVAEARRDGGLAQDQLLPRCPRDAVRCRRRYL